MIKKWKMPWMYHSVWVGLGVLLILSCGMREARGQTETGTTLSGTQLASLFQVSEGEEIQAGEKMDKSIRKQYRVSHDPILQRYVSMIGHRIAAQTHTDYPFSYTVLDNNQVVNAFSIPGGYVYITTGLLKRLRNEAQLAAVLGHESGHVIRHHGVKQMRQKSVTTMALTVLGQVSSVDMNNPLTHVGEYVLFQKFSRHDETEADLVGLQLMVKAGYSPEGMVQLLQTFNRLESQHMYVSFLQDHPSSAARVHGVERYIEEHHLRRPGQIIDSPAFHHSHLPRG